MWNREYDTHKISFNQICSIQNTFLSNLITFDQLRTMLMEGQIVSFLVEPHLQINLFPGYSMVTLTDNNGNKFFIQGRLDPSTGMIYP